MFTTYCVSCGVKVGETEDFKWLQENVKTIKCNKCSNRPPDTVISIIKNTPQLPKVQYSLEQQLSELKIMANKLGLYDASDFLKKYIK